MSSATKKTIERQLSGSTKTSKSRGTKDPGQKETKKARRQSPVSVKGAGNYPPLSKPLSSPSTFATQLIQNGLPSTDTSTHSAMQLNLAERNSVGQDPPHNHRTNDTGLRNPEGILNPKKKLNPMSVITAQAMELQERHNATASESDSSSDDSSSTSSSAGSRDASADSDTSLATSSVPQGESDVDDERPSFDVQVAAYGRSPSRTTHSHVTDHVNASNALPKHKAHPSEQSKKIIGKTEQMNNVTNSVVKDLPPQASLVKPPVYHPSTKKDMDNQYTFTQGGVQDMDALLPEIICDFADFMYTIATKVSSRTGYNWTPKALIPAATEDPLKKNTKRKTPKDPNEPRRPLSSFNLWCEEARKKLKGDDPTRSVGLQELANMWKLLSHEEKLSWEEMAKERKESYQKQMQAYKASCATLSMS